MSTKRMEQTWILDGLAGIGGWVSRTWEVRVILEHGATSMKIWYLFLARSKPPRWWDLEHRRSR
jgi:hypothetical protein